MSDTACTVTLKRPHSRQAAFIRSSAKRKMVRAGRRGGKTTGLAILAAEHFLRGKRVLYAVPTGEQVQRFWHEISLYFAETIAAKLFHKNETLHTLERLGTEQRIRAKTAWSADTLRGDYCDVLILDEFQLMNEDTWGVVGAPMMLDSNGDAVFVYTPPSFRTAGVSKAHDPRHAAKMFAMAEADTSGRWATFHFSSHENPHLSREALTDITQDMTSLAYRQEILAEDMDEVPGALWTRALLEGSRVLKAPPLQRIVVGLDPGHDAGIIVAGLGEDGHGYILEDLSLSGSPTEWATAAVVGYHKYRANCIVPERNHGGEMVETTIRAVDDAVALRTVWASQGKFARAEPVSTLYEKGRVHHVGAFPLLEDELCSWVAGTGMPSPNRLDALVWSITDLMLTGQSLPDLDLGGAFSETQVSPWVLV